MAVAIGLLGSAASADAATSVAGHMRYAIDNNPELLERLRGRRNDTST